LKSSKEEEIGEKHGLCATSRVGTGVHEWCCVWH